MFAITIVIDNNPSLHIKCYNVAENPSKAHDTLFAAVIESFNNDQD